MASLANLALMVMRADRTVDADAQEAMKARRAKIGVLGVVFRANLRRKGAAALTAKRCKRSRFMSNSRVTYQPARHRRVEGRGAG